jgi:hypothetical protein
MARYVVKLLVPTVESTKGHRLNQAQGQMARQSRPLGISRCVQFAPVLCSAVFRDRVSRLRSEGAALFVKPNE